VLVEEVDLVGADVGVGAGWRAWDPAEELQGPVLQLALGRRGAEGDECGEAGGGLASGRAGDLVGEEAVVDDALDLRVVDGAFKGAGR
jgi:hypothetical protein